jgi:hypothetical protein
VFERAFARARTRVIFTEGFNPKPRLEFASPLGLGVESEEEIASVELAGWESAEGFLSGLNSSLPLGLRVTRVEIMARTPTGKKPSLMAAFWGSEYRISPSPALPALWPETGASEVSRSPQGLVLRLPVGGVSKDLLRGWRGDPQTQLCRTRTLAAPGGGSPLSYFEAFCSSSLT